MKFIPYVAMAVTVAGISVFASQQGPTQAPPGQPAAQSPGQPATQSPARPSTQSATPEEQQVTVVGCIQREADYRRKQDAGKGGVAGTGVGGGNEFVLINASMSTGGTGSPAGQPAGGAGASAASTTGTAYELTGSGEGQASSHVGKRVEITGKLKAAETGAAGRPTGGATAGSPPAGVDVGGRDLKLRELDVTSVKEASGTCPAS